VVSTAMQYSTCDLVLYKGQLFFGVLFVVQLGAFRANSDESFLECRFPTETLSH